ncbi:17290_t:CDS:2, partial [Dentiscutata heterogama]
ELPESSFKPSKTITREQLQIHQKKLPGHNSKPTEKITREKLQACRMKCQRTAPNLANYQRKLQTREENYQRTASKFLKNLPENNSKSGEENYKRKSPNPAKKLEAEAELEKLSEIRNLPENSSKSGKEIAKESSKPGEENYQKKAQTCEENSSKPGKENYERNPAKKIEAEAELE